MPPISWCLHRAKLTFLSQKKSWAILNEMSQQGTEKISDLLAIMLEKSGKIGKAPAAYKKRQFPYCQRDIKQRAAIFPRTLYCICDGGFLSGEVWNMKWFSFWLMWLILMKCSFPENPFPYSDVIPFSVHVNIPCPGCMFRSGFLTESLWFMGFVVESSPKQLLHHGMR